MAKEEKDKKVDKEKDSVELKDDKTHSIKLDEHIKSPSENESKVENEKSELTEKERQEIRELKIELNEIDLSTPQEEDDKKKESNSTEEILTDNDDGEISLQIVSETDLELQKKIALIKSELRSELTFFEKIKSLFKSNKRRKIENELIEKKAIELNKISGPKKKFKKETKYVITSFKSTIGLFSVFYSRNDMKWRIFVACMVGLLMSFASIVFIQNTGVIITGMSGIFQGIARITKVLLNKQQLDLATVNMIYNIMFYGMYLLVNIPLIIFSYKKIGKNFTIISTIPVVISNVIPLLVNLIPGVNNLFLFGETKSLFMHIDDMGNLATKETELYKNGVTILTFLYNVKDQVVVDGVTYYGAIINDAPKFGSMLLYTIFASVINGIAYSMAMSVGGSTGGLDFISYYFAYKKNKSLTPVLLTFNISSVFLTTMLSSYISAIVVNPKLYSGYEYFFSQNLLTGIIYAVGIALMISQLFPKDKVVKITIYSSQVMKIRNHLYSKNFNHSLTINNTTGGYSLTDQRNIEIICMFIEIPKILQEIKSCDAPSLITITKIKGIEGKLTIESAIN